MDEFTNNSLRDLGKQLERTRVQAIGKEKLQELSTTKFETQYKATRTVIKAKNALTSSSEKLQKAVKGEFGTKITEILEKQEKILDDLYSNP